MTAACRLATTSGTPGTMCISVCIEADRLAMAGGALTRTGARDLPPAYFASEWRLADGLQTQDAVTTVAELMGAPR